MLVGSLDFASREGRNRAVAIRTTMQYVDSDEQSSTTSPGTPTPSKDMKLHVYYDRKPIYSFF